VPDDPHKPLRDDVRLLGDLLGETLRAQEGEDLFRTVERVRALANRWQEVLAECKAADPRWIVDRSVTTLETALSELRRELSRAALTPSAPTEEER